MNNIDIIETKISSIRKYLDILNDYKKYSQEEIEKDTTLKGAVERYLYLAIQETISLAELLISVKNFTRPSSYSEAFDILREKKIISPELTKELIKMTGFRNILVHEYRKLDFGIVYNILQNKLKDIESFLKEVAKNC